MDCHTISVIICSFIDTHQLPPDGYHNDGDVNVKVRMALVILMTRMMMMTMMMLMKTI